MTHYETLGVSTSATPAEIKAAYRKASSAAHPDKGGSTERMQAVNRANDVLSEPERRAMYDQTGQDQPTNSIEDAAREVLVEAFRQALEHLDAQQDVVDHVRGMLRDVALDVADRSKKAERKRAKLVKQRDRVRVKDGAHNLVHDLIEHQLQLLDGQLAGLTKARESAEAALKMLDAYEFVPPVGEPPPKHRDTASAIEEMMRTSMFGSTSRGSPFGRFP